MYIALIILFSLIPSFIINIAYIFVPSIIFNGFWLITYEYLVVIIFLLNMVATLGFIYVIFQPKYGLISKLYILLANLFGLIVICVNYFLQYKESINYPNYVYFSYHIHLPALTNYTSLCGLIILITLTKIFTTNKELFKIINKSNNGTITKIINGVIILIFAITLLKIPEVLFTDSKNVLRRISFNPVQLPDMPILRNQLLEIQKRTPPESVIVHPDQSVDDPELGNQVLIRYVLYPRTLVSETKYNLYLENSKTTDKVYWISAKPLNKLKLFYKNSQLPLYIYE